MNILNQRVKHKLYKTGIVIQQDEHYILVEFETKTSKFLYPGADTFTKFLVAEDDGVQAAILQEIKDQEAAIEAARVAAEEERLKAEEEARIAEALHQAETVHQKRNHSVSPAKQIAPKAERVPGRPMTFYVFQGDTFDSESQGGFIWAPQLSQGGTKIFHWENMLLVKKGDIVLHGCNGYVKAASVATSDCYDCVRPAEHTYEDAWNNNGRRVDLQYVVFRNPIKTSDFTMEILEYCRTKYSPFNKDGNGNMGYLFELNRELACVFLRAAVKCNSYLNDVAFIQNLLSEESL